MRKIKAKVLAPLFFIFVLGQLCLAQEAVDLSTADITGPGLISYSTSTEINISTSPIELGPVLSTDSWNHPFKIGEKFSYVLKYQFVSGGHATLETHKGPLINGRPTYHFITSAKSNKFVDVFFKVRDFNSAIVDASTLATFSFHQNLREGKYKVIRETQIDYDKKEFTYIRRYKGKTSARIGAVNERVTDILSAFFQARSLPLDLGESYFVRVFSDKKIYSLRIDVDDKIHKIKVPAGKFECIRVQPFVVGDNIFVKKKGGKMLLWLTNDEVRMPVLIRSKVFVGAFDAELTEYNLPN